VELRQKIQVPYPVVTGHDLGDLGLEHLLCRCEPGLGLLDLLLLSCGLLGGEGSKVVVDVCDCCHGVVLSSSPGRRLSSTITGRRRGRNALGPPQRGNASWARRAQGAEGARRGGASRHHTTGRGTTRSGRRGRPQRGLGCVLRTHRDATRRDQGRTRGVHRRKWPLTRGCTGCTAAAPALHCSNGRFEQGLCRNARLPCRIVRTLLDMCV